MAVVLAALLVGILSSWPLLRQPVLAVGAIAEQDYRAPASAQVVDQASRKARRSDLGLRTVVHEVDRRQNLLLQEALEQNLRELRRSIATGDLAVPWGADQLTTI